MPQHTSFITSPTRVMKISTAAITHGFANCKHQRLRCICNEACRRGDSMMSFSGKLIYSEFESFEFDLKVWFFFQLIKNLVLTIRELNKLNIC